MAPAQIPTQPRKVPAYEVFIDLFVLPIYAGALLYTGFRAGKWAATKVVTAVKK